MKSTCVIPIYNEKQRVSFVLESVKKCRGINEIICVDDGSSDGSGNYIKNKFKEIKVIRLNKNQGKANAVFMGAKNAKNDTVLVLDADLIKIDVSKINWALKELEDDKSLDMLVFKMKNFYLISKILRHDVLISGNFVIKKVDLLKIFDVKEPTGYELEIAVNQFMMDNNKKVKTLSFDSEGYPPIKKRGLVWTIKRDLKMYPDIIKFVGIKNIVKQTMYFGTQEIG